MQISPLGALGSLRSFRKDVAQPTRFCKNMFKSYVQNIIFPNINLAKLHSQMNTTLAICYWPTTPRTIQFLCQEINCNTFTKN